MTKSATKRSTTHLAVRPMEYHDIPAVRALAERIWHAYYPSLLSPGQIAYMLGWMYSPQRLEESVIKETHAFLLAEIGSELCGFLSIEDMGNNEYFIHKCYVDTALHGQGIGAKLIEQALATCPEEGVVKLRVNRNNLKAINFYFRMGFTLKGIINEDIGGGYVMEDFLMTRPLSAL